MNYVEVLVFIQPGCPACHDIQPVIDRIAAHYGQCARTRVVDVHRESYLSDTMMIQETPTIVGCVNFQPKVRMIGANDAEPRLAQLYQSLLDGASCQVGAFQGDV